eukprot:scaffold23672_cov83-Cyclotella_meneghiniana.AAC.2
MSRPLRSTRRAAALANERLSAASSPPSQSHSAATPIHHATAGSPRASTSNKSVSFSVPDAPESKTVTDSALHGDEEGGTMDGLVILSSMAAQQELAEQVLPLVDRIPSLDMVMSSLTSHHDISNILNTPNVLSSLEELDAFRTALFHRTPADNDFWEMAWGFMVEAVRDNIPTSSGGVKKCKDSYFLDVEYMISTHFYDYLPPGYADYPFEKRNKLHGLVVSVGYVFVEIFEMLITPPKGSKITSLKHQLDALLLQLEELSIRDYFKDDLGKHVYYVSGFLCRAGQKEAERRTKNNEVGACILSASQNHVTSDSEIESLKEALPNGSVELVTRRNVHGKLHFPNLAFYSLVAKMEYCYSKLATPENIYTYGGLVLGYVCDELATHDNLIEHFESLFNPRAYDVETRNTAFRFYLKVFGNMRLKDLVRNYNSRLSKTTTVGLRQRLATKGPKKNVNKRPREEEKDEEPTDEQVHNELMEEAENGLADSELLGTDHDVDSD